MLPPIAFRALTSTSRPTSATAGISVCAAGVANCATLERTKATTTNHHQP